MTRRRLTPEEVALWQKVAETAERLHPRDKGTAPPRPKPKPKPVKQPVPRLPLRGAAPASPAPTPGPVAMDHKTFSRMQRGKLSPEARLDLHGMRLDEAHPELIRFLLSAQAAGKRLVLVITGKGKRAEDVGPIPQPKGILRRQVPQWLGAPPLAQAVLQVTPAHIRHGGDGAFYVYLRRPR